MLKTASELKIGDHFKSGKQRIFGKAAHIINVPDRYIEGIPVDCLGKLIITYIYRDYCRQMVVDKNEVFTVEANEPAPAP